MVICASYYINSIYVLCCCLHMVCYFYHCLLGHDMILLLGNTLIYHCMFFLYTIILLCKSLCSCVHVHVHIHIILHLHMFCISYVSYFYFNFVFNILTTHLFNLLLLYLMFVTFPYTQPAHGIGLIRHFCCTCVCIRIHVYQAFASM